MSELKAGTVRKDGTICLGISPVTGKVLYLMPTDAPHLLTHTDALHYADTLNKVKSYTHNDWRLPTQAELLMMAAVKDQGKLAGTFNEASEKFGKPFTSPIGRQSPGWYRSADWGSEAATKAVFMKDGASNYLLKMEASSVRYIREEEAPAALSAISGEQQEHIPSARTRAQHRRLREISLQHRAIVR